MKFRQTCVILSVFIVLCTMTLGAVSLAQPGTTCPDARLVSTAYPRNERIVYEVSWLGIKAGDMIFTVKGDGNGKWNILMETKPSPLFSIIHPMDGRVETEVAGPDMLPEWFRAEEWKGGRKSLKSATFDQTSLRVVYKKDQEEPAIFEIPRPVHNEISSFFLLRTLPMNIGQSVFVETFSAKKSRTVEIKVLERQKFHTSLGDMNTIKVKAELPVDKESKWQGDCYIWLTEDSRRIPVKIEGTTQSGFLSAELKEWKTFEFVSNR